MKFDTPATTNPIDAMTVVGKPFSRIEGPLKVTGTAPYAYERHDVAKNQAYGYVVGAAIAKGRITTMDTAAARAAPGVLAVVTARNAGPLRKGSMNTAKLLGGPEIEHYHQAIAVVVAETFEQARAASFLLRVEYERTDGQYDLAAAMATAKVPPGARLADAQTGDFDGAFAAAAVKLDARYTTPDYTHAMMEPQATTAAWSGDTLYVWTATQMVDICTNDLSTMLDLPRDRIRFMSPFVGGGFGGKLWLRSDALMAVLGAKAAGRPVKVALTRPLIANNTIHRPATIQRVRIGAAANGTITAIGHEAWSGNLPGGVAEWSVRTTRVLYGGANRMAAQRLAVLDLPEGNAMRAPGEVPGMLALEVAMDEMAEKLGIDPVEFRIMNDTQVDPETPTRPFSQRRLTECLRQGAERFGWTARSRSPGQVRDGRWLIGQGVAAAYRGNSILKSAARVILEPNGELAVETDMTDVGTGSYTVIAQTAAEMMGLSLHQVTVRLADSTYPVSAGSGGQWGANSVLSAVFAACTKLREDVARRLGLDPAAAAFAAGQVSANGTSLPLAQAAAAGPVVAEDTMTYGDLGARFVQGTFGAHFVEVAVNAVTAEARVRRMLAVCAAGRIINPKLARNQVIGAMTMGVGSALMEELAVDTRQGFFVNHDLAGYEVPVHADIPHQDVVFLDETDPVASPLKAKGVGELGICGVGAAVNNAIYNATGIRVRDYPVTLDKLIGQLRTVS